MFNTIVHLDPEPLAGCARQGKQQLHGRLRPDNKDCTDRNGYNNSKKRKVFLLFRFLSVNPFLSGRSPLQLLLVFQKTTVVAVSREPPWRNLGWFVF